MAAIMKSPQNLTKYYPKVHLFVNCLPAPTYYIRYLSVYEIKVQIIHLVHTGLPEKNFLKKVNQISF